MAFTTIAKITCVIGIIFCIHAHAHAAIIFSEVMYDVPGADDGREWIEVANTGTEAVDMTDWKLFENSINHGLAITQGNIVISPGGAAIIADNPQKFLLDWPAFTGTIFDSAFSLSNSGETIAMKDAQSAIISTATYNSSVGAAGDGNSLHSSSDAWFANVPTPGEVSDELPPVEDTDPSDDTVVPSDETEDPPPIDPPVPDILPEDTEDATDTTPPESESNAQVIINEIMYDPVGSDSTHEWIEVFNQGPSSVDLANWKLVENETDHRMELFAGMSAIGVADFAVIADNAETFMTDHPDFTGTVFDSVFSLSNTGESIALKDSGSSIRDEVAYTATNGAAGDGNTQQRFDGGFITSPPTPGTMNLYVPPEEADTENSNPETMPPLAPITINEIAWMGIGDNQYGEWIELYNTGTTAVDLNDWKIYKDGGETLLFTMTKSIPAGGYLVIERTTGSSPDPLPNIDDESGTFGDGGFANNPTGEFLILKDSYDRTVHALDFASGWPAGNNETKKTMQMVDDVWITATPTPGTANSADPISSGATAAVSDSDSAPAFFEELTAENVIQSALLQDGEDSTYSEATTLAGLAVSLRKRDKYTFVQIENTTDTPITISQTVITNGEKSFTIPKNTTIAARAAIVVAHTKARFVDVNRALFEDGAIIVR